MSKIRIAVVVSLLAVSVLAFLFSDRSEDLGQPGSVSQSSAQIEVQGEVLLADNFESFLDRNVAACSGVSGFFDISEGTVVVVYDENSQIVGTSALRAGVTEYGLCRLSFGVRVASGRQFYRFEIGRRSAPIYEERELRDLVRMQLS